MYKLIIVVILLALTVSTSAQRTKYNFNPGWKLYVGDAAGAETIAYNDASWKSVTLPHAWNEDEAFKKDIADLSTGIAWYRKHFAVPTIQSGQKVFLEFEGVRQAADVYINGTHVGLHENGVMAFGFDITSLVKTGTADNVIAVRTDNSWEYHEKATNTKFQWIDKNFNANYGGIPKNVYLHVTGNVYQTLPLFSTLGTTGVYIYADNFNIPGKSATIHAASEIKNESTQTATLQYEVSVKDRQGKLIKNFTGDRTTIAAGETKTVQATALVNGLEFWSWGYGYLYKVETVLKVNGKTVDAVTTTTGFRKTAFKDGMIYLNDRVIQIKGYAQRTSNEWPAIGMSVPAWLSDYSNKLMVESNGNLVRWMHITPWKQDVESCDRVGLMQAMPAGDAERDVEGSRWIQRTAVMRDAIVYNRNNPSIVFYECGNESISEKHMTDMKAIRDQYDPHGGRAIGSREMLDSKVAEYGGEMLYINKSAHIPMWAMEYSRDEGLRKYWDEYTPPYHKDGDGPPYKGQSAAEYNRNQDSHAKEDIIRWYEYWKERPGTGKRVSSGGVNIIFSESNTHHRGAENYRRSGEVDAMRIYKENYFAHQVMWDGWVDIEKPRVHIIGHWNYKAGVTKDIYVVSSADKVALFINGKPAGFGEQSNRFLYTFKNIAWQSGDITAIGYDAKGKQLCTAKKSTAREPYAVKLRPLTQPGGLKADGQDIALVEFELTDAKGARCPAALDMIHFSLEGEGEWRGGIAQGPDNYILSKDLPVECGVNRILIRSTTAAGKIILKATADGLKEAGITLTSLPVIVKQGLTTMLPGAALPSNLDRGPTPLKPSFTRKREALTIVKVNAGAHADSAFESYDDNELTEWNNGGKLGDAWIEYELEKESTLREVTMKLNNFRSRSYPIRITVDGKEVFRGNTERTLGYFTAVCTPHKGRKVKIELLGNSNIQDNYGVEVSGKKLDDGVARNDANAKGTLSIIEVELYR
jgi:beta-galactosidase